ncbi:MAG: ZIP family metal transporter [Candidatus Nanohaloarchaea archaeon]
MVLETVIGAIVATSLLSGLGALFFFVNRDRLEGWLPYLVSLSAGTIFGGVFIHLVFRLSENYTRFTGLLILSGILGSFLLEKLVHWHCHHGDHEFEPFSMVLIAGDSVHNLLDGLLIASSFLASTSAGIAATVAVAMHKIPKEVGDFGILVHAGFSRAKALGFNFLVNAFMLLGAAMVLGFSAVVGNSVALLLPLVIGNFVYIAGSDLMPEVKDVEDNWWKHVAVFSIGVAMIYGIPFARNLVS